MLVLLAFTVFHYMKFEKEKFNKENKNETSPEREKCLAREVEKLPANILEKVNLLLVWRGFKPSTKLTYIFKTWGCGDPEPILRDERKEIHVEELKNLLSAMELKYIKNEEVRQEPRFDGNFEIRGKESQDFFIAQDLENAQNLAKELEKTALEIDENIKTEIQKLSPILYAEMIRELEKE